ncbi:MAG: amino acid ABC transporter permease [Coprococcus catus]|nr:amino acid ABC transporter permease [Coprococcus catus]
MMDKIITWMPQLLLGARTTIIITIIAVAIGLVLSFFLALGKMSKNPLLNKPCSAYIFFFRGTPLLIQIYFIYFGLPQFNPALTIKSAFVAALIAYTLNSAAYLAENIRAGIQSIDRGQYEAAKALGMTYRQTMQLIILPQTVRRLIPPVGNEFIMVLKDVSLVAIIGLSDLTKVTRAISSSQATALVYIPAMVIYLIITAFFSFIFNRMEKKYSVYE